MGVLRDEMQGDMKLRGRSVHTQRAYLSCAHKFAEHYHRSPAQMGEHEIKDFLLHLVNEKGVTAVTHRMYADRQE